jgi:hypothetical protein
MGNLFDIKEVDKIGFEIWFWFDVQDCRIALWKIGILLVAL